MNFRDLKRLWNCYCDLADRVTVLEAGGGGGGSGDVEFLEAVTGYTGGGATKLDGVTTTTVTVPKLYAFDHATEGVLFYLLKAGTTAESSPDIIRPDDYAGGTNEKIFVAAL